MSDFFVNSEYSPSGDQPVAIEQLSNGIINAYDKSQAIKRSKTKNKGIEAANAMVKMIECLI